MFGAFPTLLPVLAVVVDHCFSPWTPLFVVSATQGTNATHLCPHWILLYFGYAKAKEGIGKFV